MADPVAGAVQFAANIPGVRGFVGDDVNAGIKAKEAEYEAARARAGRSGFDAARLAGNVAAPNNVALASRIPAAAGTLARVGTGAAAGAVGAMATPEADAENYWRNTALKGATGGLAGAALAPVAGAVGDAIGRIAGRFRGPPAAPPPIPGPPGSHPADAYIAQAANEAGQSINDIPQSLLERLRAWHRRSMRCRRDRIWIPLRRCERQTLRRSGSSRFSGRSPATRSSLPGRGIYAALPGPASRSLRDWRDRLRD